MPRRCGGVTLRARPPVLEEVYHLSGGGVAYLLDDAVAYAVGVAEGFHKPHRSLSTAVPSQSPAWAWAGWCLCGLGASPGSVGLQWPGAWWGICVGRVVCGGFRRLLGGAVAPCFLAGVWCSLLGGVGSLGRSCCYSLQIMR